MNGERRTTLAQMHLEVTYFTCYVTIIRRFRVMPHNTVGTGKVLDILAFVAMVTGIPCITPTHWHGSQFQHAFPEPDHAGKTVHSLGLGNLVLVKHQIFISLSSATNKKCAVFRSTGEMIYFSFSIFKRVGSKYLFQYVFSLASTTDESF